ncbi:hypothetical protein ACSIGC_09635 [Tenacibaculum sp. ZS6-P6]|uniref:hypothetical protein n=1 Tax=Tenacibaculum sp. ZS6-P6 TaxID=3447503 RepID=UPI003F972CC6
MAKHWKNFVKKEKASEEKEEFDFKTLLSSGENSETGKSLEDVVEFNSSLKSLLNEQKELEAQMAELTGKKEEGDSNKKFDYEIKTIDEKRREEKNAEKKKRKRKKEDDKWRVDVSNKLKNKEVIAGKPRLKKQQQKKIESLSLPKLKNELKKGIKEVKKNKDHFNGFKKIEKESFSDVSTQKLSNSFTKLEKEELKILQRKIQGVSEKTNKVNSLLNKAKEGREKLSDFLDKSSKKGSSDYQDKTSENKENNTVKSIGKTVNKAVQIVKTASKISEVHTGIQKTSEKLKPTASKSVEKNFSKGLEIIDRTTKQINKVDQLFNTVNTYLDKTDKVSDVLNKKLESISFTRKKEKKTDNDFNLDFLEKLRTKNKENQDFKVEDKKLVIDTNTIKKVKSGIDTFKKLKDKKDSFSF